MDGLHDSTAGASGRGERRSTRDRILDVAVELFAEKGFVGAAMRDIAGGVGINAASLYNHFAGKEQIYEAVLERDLAPVIELLGQIASAPETDLSDYEAADRVVEHFAEHPHVPKLIYHDALAGGEQLSHLLERSVDAFVAPALRALEKGTDADGADVGEVEWSSEELPLLVVAFQNMILGYFALAPLVRTILGGTDPLAEESIERQKDFLRRVVRRLVPGRFPTNVVES